MDRRTFLRRLGAAGAGVALAGPAFAPWARAQGSGLPRIAYQLGWIKNFQFAGDYIADYRGYYRQFGLEVDLLSGGPTVNVEPILMSGKALVAQSMPDFMANANAKGATIKCIAACYQGNVDAIISLAKTPLTTPAGHDRQEDRDTAQQPGAVARLPEAQQDRSLPNQQRSRAV
jgi:ABC-type nitrate/sulfonate/bicarbonate transport system substrate-binding protein